MNTTPPINFLGHTTGRHRLAALLPALGFAQSPKGLRRQTRCAVSLAAPTLAALCVFLLTTVTHAALLVYEGFDTPATGALTGQSGATSFGWSGDWGQGGGSSAQVVAGAVPPPASTVGFYTLPQSPNHASGSLGGRGIRAISGSVPFTTTLWGSFLVDMTVNFNASAFVRFTSPASQGLYFAATSNSAGFWQISNGFSSFDSTAPYDPISLIIFRVDYEVSGTQDRVQVWINADPATAAPNFDRTDDYGTQPLSQVEFASSSNFSGSTIAIDEIRLGTTMTDVTALHVPSSSASGTVITIAGTGAFGFTGDGGPATNATFHFPYGLAIGPDGTLYVSDFDNLRIRAIAPATGLITTVAGNGSFGDTGNNGPATNAPLGTVIGLAVDRARHVLYLPEIDNYWVRQVNLTSGIISNFAGVGASYPFLPVLGQRGDGGPATGAWLSGPPTDIAVDGAGNVYIAEGCRIRKVDIATGIIHTIAGKSDPHTGGMSDICRVGRRRRSGLRSHLWLSLQPDGGRRRQRVRRGHRRAVVHQHQSRPPH